MESFIKTAPDNEYLKVTVALIMGMAGARHRDELAALTVDDIQDVQWKFTNLKQKFSVYSQ